jgi:hypothetical protein
VPTPGRVWYPSPLVAPVTIAVRPDHDAAWNVIRAVCTGGDSGSSGLAPMRIGDRPHLGAETAVAITRTAAA